MSFLESAPVFPIPGLTSHTNQLQGLPMLERLAFTLTYAAALAAAILDVVFWRAG